MNNSDDYLWVLVCSALVFLMQAGFLLLESGLTRRKNSVNVSIKNLSDFCISALVFWLIGYGIMFGDSFRGLFGLSDFAVDYAQANQFDAAFFLYKVMFCGTAVAILSGAVSERMRYSSYLIMAVWVSALVYPVMGHWAWAGLWEGEANGFLNQRGFVDFAGSTVVHSTGGWAALALLLVIGPRKGRFGKDGKIHEIEGSNIANATLGALLLFVGWLGFNGGSTLALNESVIGILVNTVIGAATGAISAGFLGQAIRNRVTAEQFITGCLGGLVAVTANCAFISTPIAALIGFIGGMIVIGMEQLLLKLQIDDAVGAIPVHLGAGIWGTIAVALYGDLDALGTGLNRIQQLVIQLEGMVICGIWAFGITFLFATLINKFHPLRVTAHEEELGLDFVEHGSSKGLMQTESRERLTID